ncbi:MAG: hypothetical protein QNJ69_00375 [Gammaproteobacteria bacterium]|nr:hypothetical protein [Gammaproteobacteria bacterium]
MSQFEQQLHEIELDYDRMLEEIEELDPEILFSVVPGSRLHDIINNPTTEDIDDI